MGINIFAIVILVFLVGMTAWGLHMGFVRKLVGLVAWIISFVLVAFLSPVVEGILKKTNIYTSISGMISESDSELMHMLKTVGLNDEAGMFAADKIIAILAFLITVVLVTVLIQGIAWALRIVTKLPLLHGINKLFGGVVGLGEGVLVVWLVFMAAAVFAAKGWGSMILSSIASSEILTFVFVHNPLLHFFG